MTNDRVADKQVLIVEDEPDFAALLQSILVSAGYSVAIAHNTEDALALVRKKKPDVITLDIQMPRKSGAFFYRKLKMQEESRDIPVVVVTGVTRNDRDMETIIRAILEKDDVPHPEAYLEKPIEGSDLLNTVEAVMMAGSSAG